jgi:hypothetical protein
MQTVLFENQAVILIRRYEIVDGSRGSRSEIQGRELNGNRCI